MSAVCFGGILAGLTLFASSAAAAPGYHMQQDETGVAAPQVSNAIPARQEGEAPPDVSTYAGIDAAMHGRDLLARDAQWRYFPGTEDPAPNLEWAKPDFDDSAWRTGAAPFGYGSEGLGTVVEEIGQGVTTLYLRRTVEIKDIEQYERIELDLPVDDGYLFLVDGAIEDRLYAHRAKTKLPAIATASTESSVSKQPIPVVYLSRILKEGPNQLALQVLVHPTDRDTLEIRPRLRVVYAKTPAGESTRLAELQALVAADSAATDASRSARQAYVEGLYWQRAGAAEQALDFFIKAATLDPAGVEPWERMRECERTANKLARLEARLNQWAGGAETATPAYLNSRARVMLEDMQRTPQELVAALKPTFTLPESGFCADAFWAGEQLLAGRTLRINCGSAYDLEVDGRAWSRDRFFSTGVAYKTWEGDDGDEADSSEASQEDTGFGFQAPQRGIAGSLRSVNRFLNSNAPIYRIPLSNGAYELRLHMVGNNEQQRSAGDAVMEVRIEGALAAAGYDPTVGAGQKGLDTLRFPVYVTDGFLEIDLLPSDIYLPWVAGIEVLPVETAAFAADAAAWVDATHHKLAFPLVQLAEAQLAQGDADAALASLAEARRLASFSSLGARRLRELRAASLPHLASFDAIDALVAELGAGAESMLASIAEADEEEAGYALYFEGRLRLAAGDVDAALGAFETLVSEGTLASEPTLRMTQCLAKVGLQEEALGFLLDAIDGGVDLDDSLLQEWISLELEADSSDPWRIVAALDEFDAPAELDALPTSHNLPRTWQLSDDEPTTTAWSRTTYDASSWPTGPAPIGSGHSMGSNVRTLWNDERIFARQEFQLASSNLLYPHLKVHADDALEVYINGTREVFVGVNTKGYILIPLRKGTLVPGLNILGMVAQNLRGGGAFDGGIVQPLGELRWIAQQLDSEGGLRINCGGDSIKTMDGVTWAADRGYGWGLSSIERTGPRMDVAGTELDELYLSYRWFFKDSSDAKYQLPLPNGKYRVTMHFAELSETWREPGKRVFSVKLETQVVLDKLDVVKEVGFGAALVRSFEVQISDGWLDIDLADKKVRTYLSGLQVERLN